MQLGRLLCPHTGSLRYKYSILQTAAGTTLKQEVLIFFPNFPDAFLSCCTWSQSASLSALLSFQGGLAWDLSGGDGMERKNQSLSPSLLLSSCLGSFFGKFLSCWDFFF